LRQFGLLPDTGQNPGLTGIYYVIQIVGEILAGRITPGNRTATRPGYKVNM